jgi:hypothetical protein
LGYQVKAVPSGRFDDALSSEQPAQLVGRRGAKVSPDSPRREANELQSCAGQGMMHAERSRGLPM